MLTIPSRVPLTGLSGREITDFLLECDGRRHLRMAAEVPGRMLGRVARP